MVNDEALTTNTTNFRNLLRKGETYEQQLGRTAPERVGDRK
ncbi:MAG: hypothetical protein N2235_06700 [Fischerella sp.]|nr:hypothetical protein [Fischerella sp.]